MKKVKISLILNSIIFILVTIGSLFMFLGIRFMKSELLLEVTKIGMLKFFTVDSNIFVGIVSLILAIYEYKFLKKKIKEIPNWIYLLKMISTTAVTITFLVTLLFLSPMYGFYAMYNNSNLFFHLIVPILSIVSYIVYEKHNTNNKHALYAVIPTVLYSIFYITNILLHLNDGGLTYKYDFYGFTFGNVYNFFIVGPAIYLITYLISRLLLFLNKKIKICS